MLVTCIVVSHNKPAYCRDALDSLTAQTYPQWQGLIIDSGVLYDQHYFSNLDSRFSVHPSHETPRIRRCKAMAPWCINECFRRNLVLGELVVYLCDDDIFYPNALATFVEYAQRLPCVEAMYASEDVGILHPAGWCEQIGQRRAIALAGKCCRGRPLDCRVDYLQFCHRRRLLDRFPSREWWPESKLEEHHADGVFMEQCGSLVPIHPIDVLIGMNRRTPQSVYAPLRSPGLNPQGC